MENKHLLNFHDAVIYPSDLALLDSPTAWLNDACINFQLTRLQHRRTQNDEPRSGEAGAESEQKRQRQNDDDRDGDGGGERIDQLEDLFIDPSVISFLMHQLPEDDEDYDDELSNLNASWKLPQPPQPPQPPTYGHQLEGTKKLNSEQLRPQKSATRKHQRKRLFVPINDQFGETRATFSRPGGGSHWSLLMWEINAVHVTDEDGFHASMDASFCHFDSSRGINTTAAIAVAKKLRGVMSAPVVKKEDVADAVVFECRTPRQRNGHDCGALALGYAEALSAPRARFLGRKEQVAFLRSRVEEEGGLEEFAARLRKRIGDDIRDLVEQKN